MKLMLWTFIICVKQVCRGSYLGRIEYPWGDTFSANAHALAYERQAASPYVGEVNWNPTHHCN